MQECIVSHTMGIIPRGVGTLSKVGGPKIAGTSEVNLRVK